MFQSLVIIVLVSRIKYLLTQVTWITENIRIVVRLNMVSCAGTVLVGKIVTQSAVEPSIIWASMNKLE